MRSVLLFGEDSFHESFVGALVSRAAEDFQVKIDIRVRSSRGGLPKLVSELHEFFRDLNRERTFIPDAVVIAADANCEGYQTRKQSIGKAASVASIIPPVISAIPDPHIERWMLVDEKAFGAVFGRGCTLPAIKCAKDEYKRLLRDEIHRSGIDSPLGGQEFAEEIVAEMNLVKCGIKEPSLGRFLKEIKGTFQGWRQVHPARSHP